MKINISQWKEKKSKEQSAEKLNCISVKDRNGNSERKRANENLADYQKNRKGRECKNVNNVKDVEDGGCDNAHGDDCESTKQFTRCQNYLTPQNLMLDSNLMRKQIKTVRKSENILIPGMSESKTKCLSQKNLTAIKSASNLHMHIHSKLANLKKELNIQEKDEKDDEIRELLRQIQEVERNNEKMKEQNRQFRLMKLSASSQQMEMLGLKLEMQELTQKIGALKSQGKTAEDSKFSEYYTGEKIRHQSEKFNNYTKACFQTGPQPPKKKPSQTTQRINLIAKSDYNFRSSFLCPYVTSPHRVIDIRQTLNQFREKEKRKEKYGKNLGRKKVNKMCEKETQTGEIEEDQYNSYYKKE